MRIEPYLFFDGRCEEAIEFYKANLGAEVQMMMRFKDSPQPPKAGECGNAPPDAVMHATLLIGDSVVMASDGNATGHPKFEGFSLSFSARNDLEAQKIFDALAGNGGKVCVPLTKTFFSSSFGMVDDRFGVHWMVIVPQK